MSSTKFVHPPRWLSNAFFLTLPSIVIVITSYLLYQIIRSQRGVSTVAKSTLYPALTFLCVNWFFTLWLITGKPVNLFTFLLVALPLNIPALCPSTVVGLCAIYQIQSRCGLHRRSATGYRHRLRRCVPVVAAELPSSHCSLRPITRILF